MHNRDEIMNDLNLLSPSSVNEVYDFVQFLKIKDKNLNMILSETSLKNDWLLPEEDEAWKNL